VKVQITLDVDDQFADPDHEFGLTDEAWLEITEFLGNFGEDVTTIKVEDEADGD